MINESNKYIAFLGPKGSYSHIAAMLYINHCFDQIIEYSCYKFSDIFKLVEQRQVEYGILPIQNSNSGLIDEVCDLLFNTQLILIADITIPIQHHILVNRHTSLKKIQIIYSHSQPVRQCSKFLKKFSQWKIIFCKSSSIAMQTVAYFNESYSAALGSMQGGICYGLQPLSLPQKIISNHNINMTRFIILKNTNLLIMNSAISTKIMLVISLDQNLKKIFLILKILQNYHINISFFRLKNMFYKQTNNMLILEIIGHLNNIYIKKAFIEIQKISFSFKILGCYSSIIT